MTTPIPCPWCGLVPVVLPEDPKTEGNCWAQVACVNADCPAKPSVRDGEMCNDERGSDAYKEIAIQRWNKRA